jgi:glycerophosphoryl diester phosphodiesterase
MNLLLPAGRRPYIVGHRGVAECAPENTMISFRQAAAQGADLIETDVQLSADGHLAVIHDQTLERTTNGRGRVADLTLSELQALDAGSWFPVPASPGPHGEAGAGQVQASADFSGERLPTLDQVLDWARDKVGVVIEIKNGPVFYREIEQKVVEALRQHDMVERAMVISFDHPCLRQVKALCPDLATGAITVARLADPVAAIRAVGADALLPLWSLLTRAEVEACHAAGIAVCPWGAHPDYPYLLSLSVDALSTEHPAALLKLLNELAPGRKSPDEGRHPRNDQEN